MLDVLFSKYVYPFGQAMGRDLKTGYETNVNLPFTYIIHYTLRIPQGILVSFFHTVDLKHQIPVQKKILPYDKGAKWTETLDNDLLRYYNKCNREKR